MRKIQQSCHPFDCFPWFHPSVHDHNELICIIFFLITLRFSPRPVLYTIAININRILNP